MNLQTIIDWHADARTRLLAYAKEADMKQRDSEHYKGRADFHACCVSVLEDLKSKEAQKDG